VINHDKDKSYIFSFDEFRFYDGVLDALKFLSSIFSRIVVVTNQRGVGRGLMTEETLIDIHHRMQEQIEKAGGRIDAIFTAQPITTRTPTASPILVCFTRQKRNFLK
jgi:Histidinol phosphatase and related phosphatases